MVDPVGFHPIGRTRAVADPERSETLRKTETVLPDPTGPTSVPSLSQLVTIAQELAQAGPPVDYAKIAQIRQAIASGNYEVRPGAIAGAMLAFGKAPDA